MLQKIKINVLRSFHKNSCVAASNGARLGKGKGYGEVEWGVLSAIGAVDPQSTPVLTICHDLQLVADAELPTR